MERLQTYNVSISKVAQKSFNGKFTAKNWFSDRAFFRNTENTEKSQKLSTKLKIMENSIFATQK